MVVLPFDAHNHVHMGPSPPVRALLPECQTKTAVLSGMAIMSTHPRDFDRVLDLSQNLPALVDDGVGDCSEDDGDDVKINAPYIVPCLGVHPWFLHELSEEDWEPIKPDNKEDNIGATGAGIPKWIHKLELLLQANPNAIVGEIGLDGFHFDPNTEELTSPMERQVEAFRLQMELAARLERPVSIHTVQCFGPLFETLSQIKKQNKGDKQDTKNKKKKAVLPPKLYFHAFGGKAATIDQILALCDAKNKDKGNVYFGFAPVVNFRSPKTADVIRKVGIDRLVLETDHEDASLVSSSMEEGIEYISNTLGITRQELVERTTANALELYNLN